VIAAFLKCNASPHGNGHPAETELLHTAAHKDWVEVGKLLLNAGIGVNTKSNSNKTALCFAVERGNHRFADMLLKEGAEITTYHNWRRSDMGYLMEMIRKSIIEIRKNNFENRTKEDSGILVKLDDETWVTTISLDQFFTAKILFENGGKLSHIPAVRDYFLKTPPEFYASMDVLVDSLLAGRVARETEYHLLSSFFEGLIGEKCGQEMASFLLTDFERSIFDKGFQFHDAMKLKGSEVSERLRQPDPCSADDR